MVPLAITAVLAVIVSVGSSGQYVRDPPPLAADTLTSVQLFAFGGVGFAPRISDGERAFRVVMRKPHDEALQIMETIFANGTVEAKSYALAGIHALDPERFDALYQSVAKTPQKVHRMQGCIRFEDTLPEIAKQIRSGAYDKDVRLQSVAGR
ncbi:hypothetical protein JAO29_21795 [Edaphobacter sp. HDX4]|uniref:hypothetical protein n=1 Tax=Edaphobacter sp. HDX4 TaxID=2794064 RepID=UPI002FE5C346